MSKKIERCIHIFPSFKNSASLDNIRNRYDYLCSCIEAHITLVFPFKSDLSIDEITLDLQKVLSDIKPFEIRTKDIQAVDNHGYYLFLNIDEGSDIISKLHYKFHKGILSPYQSEWTKDGSFLPHITIGRFDNSVDMNNAWKEVKDLSLDYVAVIDRVYVEIIGDNEESIIEGEILFENNY